jgi:hypothetical protein
MTGHREPWYLDRLRAELERAAVAEDRRERRGARGRVRVPLKPALAFAAIVIAVAIAVAVFGSAEEERSAAPPAPTVTPTSAPDRPEAILERLDGIYRAQITPPSVVLGTHLLPTGWYRITIRAADSSFLLSDPENGGYEHTITGASPHRLAFAPDGNCEVPEQRGDPASVEFSLKGSLLTLRGARGGCQPIWQLLTSTPWYKEKD